MLAGVRTSAWACVSTTLSGANHPTDRPSTRVSPSFSQSGCKCNPRFCLNFDGKYVNFILKGKKAASDGKAAWRLPKMIKIALLWRTFVSRASLDKSMMCEGVEVTTRESGIAHCTCKQWVRKAWKLESADCENLAWESETAWREPAKNVCTGY